MEGHVIPDHVHMCCWILPKYRMFRTNGKFKGKSTILLHQNTGGKQNFIGLKFWVRGRGYCVSRVGLDEAVIRDYIRTQDEREKREDQMGLGFLYGKFTVPV